MKKNVRKKTPVTCHLPRVRYHISHLSICGDSSSDTKIIPKRTETDRNGQTQTEAKRNREEQTETDRKGQKRIETDRNGEKQIKTDRKGQKRR